MLREDSIHVWRVRLDAGTDVTLSTLYAWRAMLSEEERRKADAFHRREHARDYLTAHVALRTVLGHCLGVTPDQVELSIDDGSKPALPGHTEIRFNLSHTRDFALIAVALGREVGVDIEWQRPMEDLEAMAGTVMSEEEFLLWKGLPPTEQSTAFYNLWTRKEAYLKAIGLGLYRSLQDVTVPVSAAALGALPDGMLLVRDRAGKGNWWVADIPQEGVYSTSLCWEGDGLAHIAVQELVWDGQRWQV